MIYEILPDPRALMVTQPNGGAAHALHIHRLIPDEVPVGHFDARGKEIVDAMVPRSIYLDWIQQACAALGERLEVRFFDHFEQVFDASLLDSLSEIRRLSIDCLWDIRNADAIGRMTKITRLRFGPHRLTDAKILGALGLHRLTEFTLATTPTPTIDLSALADAQALHTLRLLGHGKNTEAIGELKTLTELAIQPSAKFSLDCLGQLQALTVLKFVLGSITSIGAVGALPALRDLSFREVRNLEDLGDLERFPSLRRLQVSDQPRLTELHVGPRNAALEHIYLYSLPRLRALRGLSALPAVKSLFAYNSQISFAWADLPPTLTHYQLVTKSLKGREAHNADVRAKGLIADSHPDATFFYK